MIYDYIESDIEGVFLLDPHSYTDARGSITKTFHKECFDTLGLECDWGESLVTTNYQKGVIRGFHFQKPPYCQAKTIFCATGSIIDVVLDLRKGSKTYGMTARFPLDSQKKNVLYVPQGVANCYAICQDNTIIVYNLTSTYMPEFESGIRWDSVGVDFGFENPIVAEKDCKLPSLDGFITPFIYGKNCL